MPPRRAETQLRGVHMREKTEDVIQTNKEKGAREYTTLTSTVRVGKILYIPYYSTQQTVHLAYGRLFKIPR